MFEAKKNISRINDHLVFTESTMRHIDKRVSNLENSVEILEKEMNALKQSVNALVYILEQTDVIEQVETPAIPDAILEHSTIEQIYPTTSFGVTKQHTITTTKRYALRPAKKATK
jgi:DNA-binding transcriptional regulator GbsR (MarR family)